MKFSLVLMLSLFTFSSFAQTLASDLETKDCSLIMKKTITIKKNEMVVEKGDISFLSPFHNKNLKLNKGSYPILDVTEGTIGINKGVNLVLVCINDGDTCLKDLHQVNTNDIFNLSDRTVQIECN